MRVNPRDHPRLWRLRVLFKADMFAHRCDTCNVRIYAYCASDFLERWAKHQAEEHA